MKISLTLTICLVLGVGELYLSSAGLRGNGKDADVNEPDDVPGPALPEIEEDESILPQFDKNGAEADAKAVAELLGLGVKETKVLLKQQREFSAVVELAQEDDNFMQGEMPSEPDGEFVIKYKKGKAAPKYAQNLQRAIDNFKTENMIVKVSIVATDRSLKEAKARGERVSKKLEKKGFTHVLYAIDGDDLQLHAKKPANNKMKNDKGQITPKQTAEILEINEGDEELSGVTLFLDDKDPAVPDHTYGGRKICKYAYSVDDGKKKCRSECSTGFSVSNYDAGKLIKGVVTAGHCQGMNRYDAVPPEADYATSFQRQHMGVFGDFEWHTTPHAELPYYYATPTSRRAVTSVARSISKNEAVCSYSRMNGTRKCDVVLVTSLSANYDCCPRMSNLVLMKERHMIEGDSGGPWSFANKAYGIHSGSARFCEAMGTFPVNSWECRDRNIYSRAEFLPIALPFVQVSTT